MKYFTELAMFYKYGYLTFFKLNGKIDYKMYAKT